VEFKVHKLYDDTRLPEYAHPGDAGMDVFSREEYLLKPGQQHTFKLGFAAELSDGYVVLIWSRSGLAHKHGVHCLSGVIDAGYRGEYVVGLYNTGHEPYQIKQGDKIAQILIQPVERATIVETDTLTQTTRADGRYASTGR
jgi:dUTP pyrophosphatase